MRRLVLAMLAAAIPAAAVAQGLDDVLAGFDDGSGLQPAQLAPSGLEDVLAGFDGSAAETLAEDAPAATDDGPLRISGVVSQRAVVNTGGQGAPFDGLSSLKTQLNLTADIDIGGGWRGRLGGHAFYDSAFAANGRGAYQPGYLDVYESEVELGEAYVQGSLGPDLDLKLGRQIVVWGKSDAIRVTDILNPLDMRDPGLTDIRDLRLPVTMARLDYYTGDWNFTAVAIPEIRFNKMPVFGSDFFPGPGPAPQDDSPGEGFGEIEYAAALNGTFPGWDLSFYAASVFNDAPHGEMTGAGLRRRHARLAMAGASANVSSGNWLWKAEAAHLDGLKFLNAPGREFSRLDLLVGFDYSGLPWGMLTVEAAKRHIIDFDPVIAGGPEDARQDDLELALRLGGSLMRDRLDLNATVSFHGPGGKNGGFQRLEAAYELGDRSKVIFGGVNYDNGNKAFFQSIGDKDRVYAKFEYRF